MRVVAAAAVVVALAACQSGNGEPGAAPESTQRAQTLSESSTVAETTPAATALPTTTVVPSTTAATGGTATTTLPAESTTTVATTAVPPDAVLALDVLALVKVENEQQAGYNRDAYGYPADADGNGCNTRDEVLIEETPAGRIGTAGGGCNIVNGMWFSVYDGETWTDPNALGVDHVVALKEAHDSGAWAWDDQRRVAFANDLSDPRTLRAVTAAVNEGKGDADPSNWLPPSPEVRCEYLADWIAIKVRWELSMDQSEHGRIRNLLAEGCPGQLITPWSPVPPPPPSVPPVSDPPPIQPAVPLPQPPQDDGGCDPAYPTACIPASPPDLDCGDISARRFRVLPPDPHRFDGDDDDGVGCESD